MTWNNFWVKLGNLALLTVPETKSRDLDIPSSFQKNFHNFVYFSIPHLGNISGGLLDTNVVAVGIPNPLTVYCINWLTIRRKSGERERDS